MDKVDDKKNNGKCVCGEECDSKKEGGCCAGDECVGKVCVGPADSRPKKSEECGGRCSCC